ncbi:MAG: phage tail protein [Roseibium sp.]|uniref:phage tail protein n=1 Tax=Alphaproteobacteria TaxID=28211 RepID=UPI003262EDCD
MALPAFAPPVAPSPGTGHNPEISLRKADFGDGYTQSSPAGLNHIRQVITLRWDGLTPDQAAMIRDFLAERGGWQAFWYQPHGHATRVKWTCEEWSSVSGAPWSFTAKLRQCFTAET